MSRRRHSRRKKTKIVDTADKNAEIFVRAVWVDIVIIIIVVCIFGIRWFFHGYPERDLLGSVQHLWYIKNALMEFKHIPLWCPWWGCGSSNAFFTNTILSHLIVLPFTFLCDYITACKVVMFMFHILAGLSMYGFVLYIFKRQDAALIAGIIYPIVPMYIIVSSLWGHLSISLFYAFVPLMFYLYIRLLQDQNIRYIIYCGIAGFFMFWLDNQRTLNLLPFLLLILLFEIYQQYDRKKKLAYLVRRDIIVSLLAGSIAVGLACFILIPAIIEVKYCRFFTEETIESGIKMYTLKNLLYLIDRMGIISYKLQDYLDKEIMDVSESTYYMGILAIILTGIVFFFCDTIPKYVRRYFMFFICCSILGLWLSFGACSIYECSMHIIKHGIIPAGMTGWMAGIGIMALGVLYLWVYRRYKIDMKRYKDISRLAKRYAVISILVITSIILILFVKPFVILREIVPIYNNMRNPGYFMVIIPYLSIGLTAACIVFVLKKIENIIFRRIVFLSIVCGIIIDYYPYTQYFGKDVNQKKYDYLHSVSKYIAQDNTHARTITVEPYIPFSDMSMVYSKKPSAWCWVSWLMPEYSGKYILCLLGSMLSRFYDKEKICGDGDMAYKLDNQEGKLTAQLAGIANIKYILDYKKFPPDITPTKCIKQVYDTPYITVFENVKYMDWVQIYPVGVFCNDKLPAIFPWIAILNEYDICMINSKLPSIEDYPYSYLNQYEYILVSEHNNIQDKDKLDKLKDKIIELKDISKILKDKDRTSCKYNYRYQRISPEKIYVEITTEKPVTLMISESYHHNWHVYVDKKEQELLRVNYGFMGVMINKGKHEVEFRYEKPKYYNIAAGISLLTMCIVLSMQGIIVYSRLRLHNRENSANV